MEVAILGETIAMSIIIVEVTTIEATRIIDNAATMTLVEAMTTAKVEVVETEVTNTIEIVTITSIRTDMRVAANMTMVTSTNQETDEEELIMNGETDTRVSFNFNLLKIG